MDKNLGDGTHTTGVGTVGTNVVATEYGNGKHHLTLLTLTAVAVTVGDNASLGVGALIYTFPAGACYLHATHGSLAMTMEDIEKSDTPEMAIGTVIATGAVSVLGGTATFEDIGGTVVLADTNGAASIFEQTTVGDLIIAASEAHTVHVNFADTWANVADTDSGVTGTVWLDWTLMA